MRDELAVTYEIVSVNVGQPRARRVVTPDGVEHTVVTAIFKSPVEGPVRVRWWGLEGDGQANTRVIHGRQVHGGEHQAVYVYPASHYQTWRDELARDLPYGQFGENLTVQGLLEHEVRRDSRGDSAAAGYPTAWPVL